MEKVSRKTTKLCSFYVSDWHLVTMLLPYLNEEINKENKIVTLLETNIKEKASASPEKEGGDIASDLTHYMEILESQESLMFDGEPLDDESKELLLISLKNTMELAKKMKERKKSGLLDNK